MEQNNTSNYRFKYEYDKGDCPIERYERECKLRRELDIKSGKILTPDDYAEIKTIIIENFTQRGEEEKLTDEFIKSELGIVIKHVKNKHSHHMNSRYLSENYSKIKAIVGNKYP